MLRELDLDFEYVQVDVAKGEHRRPEFLAVNPAGKVPVLLVGENVTVADLVEALPNLRAYMERMYARPKAPQRIAQAFASLRG